MLVVDGITMQEHAIDEPVPLAQIQRAVLEFVTGRDTLVVFGAHAVNAYVAEPRMTQDIDLLSTQAADDAESLRAWLADRFHISVRVHEVASGAGYRVYQIRKPRNRHLIDVRQVGALPSVHMVDGIPVIAPADLVASKVLSFVRRRGQPKSGTDWRDIAELLLAVPAHPRCRRRSKHATPDTTVPFHRPCPQPPTFLRPLDSAHVVG